MRPALILAALPLFAGLAACGDKGDDAGGPERRTAAGEVLGGEVSDAMLPLDTTRSTSPPAPRGSEGEDGGVQAQATASPGIVAPDEAKPVAGATPLPQPSQTLPAQPPTQD